MSSRRAGAHALVGTGSATPCRLGGFGAGLEATPIRAQIVPGCAIVPASKQRAYRESMTDRRRLLERLRDDAIRRAAAASSALSALVHDREGTNDDDEHDPEGVTLSSEWSRLSALSDAAASELAAVDDALRRLDAGAYGVCVDCGRTILAARLEARPFAERCVPCAENAGR